MPAIDTLRVSLVEIESPLLGSSAVSLVVVASLLGSSAVTSPPVTVVGSPAAVEFSPAPVEFSTAAAAADFAASSLAGGSETGVLPAMLLEYAIECLKSRCLSSETTTV